jgi:pyruvate/2-oxoglutarate/acetoin dehydrogenase E1 component
LVERHVSAQLPLDKAEIVREGTDVTITCFSRMVNVALEAAETLAAEGISVEASGLGITPPLV